MTTFDINPFTGLPDLTGSGGGGGGDGIKKINGQGPDASGNYVIKSSDIPNASESSKGAAPLATSEETIKGEVGNKIVTPATLAAKLGAQTKGKLYQGNGPDKPGEWVDVPTPPAPSFVPMPSIRFDNATVAQANHCYWLIDPVIVTPAPLQLPERGNFKQDDEILVVNATGSTFKVTIKPGSADIIRFDDKLIEDIDGKFLLSEGPGSFVLLKALSSQMWVVIYRNRISIGSGE